MNKQELRLAGSGGQGIILATVVLAEAAVLAGKYTAQSQAYGPEARGGSCKAETIISEEEIGFTKVQQPTFLMALTQKALDMYAPGVSKDCVVLIDSSLTAPESLAKTQVVALPILETAKTKIGKIQTANIVSVGCINTLLNLFPDDVITEAVKRHIPRGTEVLNMKALEEGKKLAAQAKSGGKK